MKQLTQVFLKLLWLVRSVASWSAMEWWRANQM
jgi:hypothetical protein